MKQPRLKRKLSEEEIERFYLWLHTTPGYRELIRQRISDEQKRRRFVDARRRWRFTIPEGQHPKGVGDVDHLGREVEGCG